MTSGNEAFDATAGAAVRGATRLTAVGRSGGRGSRSQPRPTSAGRRCALAPDDGTLRAIADGEVADGWRPDLDAHVQSCEECRERTQALRTTAALAHGRMVAIAPNSSLAIAAPTFESVRSATPVRWGGVRAWASMGSGWSPWVARAGAVAAAVALAVSWPAVSSFADGALQSFRVQRVQPITIDADALRGRFAELSIDEAKVRDALRYRGPDKPTITITSQSDAAARSGLALRLPKTIPAAVGAKPARYVVTSGGAADVTIDGPKLVKLAVDAKVSDAALMSRIGALDGATITVQAAPAVVAVWGDVDIPTQVPTGKAAASMSTPAARGPVLVVGQVKSPVVNIPASVDVDGFRDAVMKSGTVPPEFVQALSAVKDWRTTLPIPTGGPSGLRQVDVDGTTATVSSRAHEGKTVTTVVWVRDGVIYGVAGDVPEADILIAARSLVPTKS